MKISFRQLQPHLFAIGIFLVVAAIFCKPAIQGMAVEQQDLMQWKGMAQDGFNYKEKHGDFPEWTNSMFGGMPAYAIAFESNAYIANYLTKILTFGLPEPISYFFLCCITFYFLSQVMRIKPWLGVVGALAFAYASYNPIIIVTGHHTKMMAIAYMPAVLGAILLIFERKQYLLGAALGALFSAAFIAFNHLQMVYYLLLALLIMAFSYLIIWVKEGQYQHMVRSAVFALVAGALGVLACAVSILTTYDYAPETMRGGKANLEASFTGAEATATKGLDVDYAFRWSYGIAETMTLLVANANGGGSTSLGEDSKFYETIIEKIQTRQLDQNTAQNFSRFGTAYWGNQPFTSGPVYLGAIAIFLVVISLFTLEGRHKWWMISASILGIVLAWGSNFMAFNEFLFNYLPLYNKFRAPSQSLVMPQLLFPFMGILGLQQLLYGNFSEIKKMEIFKKSALVMGGLLLIAVFYYFMADYKSGNEKDMVRQITQSNPEISVQVKDILNAAAEDRQGLYAGDLFRTIALVLAVAAFLFLFLKNKISGTILMIGIPVLVLIDQLPVAKRYLSNESYIEKENTDVITYISQTNPPLFKNLNALKQDPDPHFRIFNTTTDPFNDAFTSAMARSVGGYHPAKLSLYQDIIENQLSKQNMSVYNMLNTKYFLVAGEGGNMMIQQNPDALGAAWLVKDIKYVANANEEMQALDSINVAEIAVIQESFRSAVSTSPVWDSVASISLSVYDNDVVSYSVNAPTPQFAVLSEVYYPRGWKAYADGKEVPIVKTNYVLRGVSLPAGTKELKLTFKPDSYYKGRTITFITELVIVLLLIVAIGLYIKNNKRKPGKS
jgi:hypothetical protein